MKLLSGWRGWRRRKARKGDDFSDLEAYLQVALSPVDPRPGFVPGLKARLMNAPAPQVASAHALQYVLLGAVGMLSTLIIVVTGIRATVTLLGALGVLRHARSRVALERAAQPEPAV